MTGSPDWTPRLGKGDGPLYLRIASAIADDIAAGRLRPGDRLPSQRALADALDIDMTTVTRAYAEGRRRRLLDAVTGRGSFVAPQPDRDAAPLDLAMILPPRPRGLALGDLVRRGLEEVLLRSDPDALMAYHPGAGLEAEKAAGAVWLEPVLGDLPTQRPGQVIVPVEHRRATGWRRCSVARSAPARSTVTPSPPIARPLR